MATQRALLLIADIGGYTEYMQYHRSMLGHAEAATRRLLDKIVGAARGFDLIEIEGDAAFLSRDLFRNGGSASTELVVHEIGQDLEDIGHVQTFYVDVEDMAGPLGPGPA